MAGVVRLGLHVVVGVGLTGSRNAVRNPLRGPIIGPANRVAAVVASVRNFRSDAVSGASSDVAIRKPSRSASLWMVRSVKRYWCTSEPLV